jgi:capsular exopolysaccharide synthesis family protein
MFLITVVTSFVLAFLLTRYSIPIYEISSSILIKEDNSNGGGNVNDYINSNLFGKNQNFQNELWVLQSSPVIKETIKNLDISVNYYKKEGFQYRDAYKKTPFKVLFSSNHVQPLYVRFHITFQNSDEFVVKAESDEAQFFDYSSNSYGSKKFDWNFSYKGKTGKLIENSDLSFIIEKDSLTIIPAEEASDYSFELINPDDLINAYKNGFKFEIVDKKATVIKISLFSESVEKGIDLVNGLMDAYSRQNLERKNHIASITIDYIEKQLGEISDSLNQTEDNLQKFRSSNQLLDVNEQAQGISEQYMNLQNQRAELVSKKRYYDYVSDYLSRDNDFSKMVVPASMGIQDQILNDLMSELIMAQSQRANLIENKQEKNPLIKKLDIQIANAKKTIIDNISAVRQTTDISLDELNKRISRTEARISNLPRTQRQLGGIERKYRLNDAIYNYLLEKRAEAKITKASNLPDDIIIESASASGSPVAPSKKKNFFFAFVLGMGLPFGYLVLKNLLNNKIETQEDLERITDVPVVGKILHNNKKSGNVMFEYPKSPIAESYRALRTNLDYYLTRGKTKVILITSCIEGEGKSFNALNIAMSYAQMNRKTILLDFDLRKQKTYFHKDSENSTGISSYLINNATLEDIILKSPHEKLDYICSGPIPPNPAELVTYDETENMIDILKQYYDYIIIDSPPLAQVTDGYLLMKHVDLKVVVTRFNFSKKNVISIVMKDLKQKEIKNICLIMNDNRIKGDQYGYGYGYYKK